LIFILASAAFSWCGSLQETSLDNSTKAAIIDWICMKMSKIYVFPDVAKKMEEHIRNKFKN